MGDVNKTVSINYTASTKDLEKGLKNIPKVTDKQGKEAVRKLDNSFNKMEKGANSTSKKVARSMKHIGKSMSMVGVSVVAIGAGVITLNQKFADLTNEMVDASAKTGIAVDTLAGLRLALEGSGLEFSNMESGLIKFQSSIVNASNGSKSMSDNFSKLGVDIKDSNDKIRDADGIFNDVVKSLGEMENATERNATAMKLFGMSGGPALIQSGALENLENMTTLATEFGVNLGTDGVNAMGDFQRKMAEMELVAVGGMQKLMNSVTGGNGVNMAIEGMTKSIIFFGSIAEDITAALGAGYQSFFAMVQSGIFMINGDFERAGVLMNDVMNESEKAVMNLADTFGTASEKVEQFEKLSARSTTANNMEKVEQKTQSTAEQMKAVADNAKKAEKAVADMQNQIDSASGNVDNLVDAVGERFMSALQKEKQSIMETGVLLEEQFNAHSKLVDAVFERIIAGDESVSTEKQLTQLLEEQIVLGDTLAKNKIAEQIELDALRTRLDDEQYQRAEENHQRELDRNQELKDKISERISSVETMGQTVLGTFGSISQAITDVNQKQIDEIRSKADSDLSKIDKMVESGVISSENASKRKERIEEKYQKSIAQQRKKMFALNQATAISDVIFQGAIASARAIADYGLPAGLAVAGLAVAQTGAQLASIKAQTPPKFDVGGMVGNATDNAPDMVRANLLSGEAILDRATVRNIGGESGVRQLQRGESGGDRVIVVQPFKHFDRFVKSGGMNQFRQRGSVSGVGGY